MKPPAVLPADSLPTSAAGPEGRADRLLHGMYKVCSHDLPNQLVALQSLLQLLQMEEEDRLSEDGREYVRRLLSVTARAGEMVRFLKEMGRLTAYQPHFEEVALGPLARGLRAELAQRQPGRALEFEWAWDVAAVRADYKTLSQALLELVHTFVGRAGGSRCVVRGSSRRAAAGVELQFAVTAADPAPGPAVRPPLEHQADYLLAREWLAAGGAQLMTAPDEPGRFTVLVPD